MFFASFETDARLLARYWRESLFIGAISYMLPFALVAATALYVFRVSGQSSMLLGIGLSTTSLALVYAVLKDKQALDRRFSQMLLSAAMVVDVLNMLSLILMFEGVSWLTLVLPAPLFVGSALSRWGQSRTVGSSSRRISPSSRGCPSRSRCSPACCSTTG
ncbi:hypothetical protein FJZ36_07000 [Candidatus Poribacteria bacterium]|nr:hypothetical protein [Candidatus Poribacteria bacterium]